MEYRQKVGQFGEDLAVKFLLKKGYRIIERNKKISYQEIDIIAKIANKIVFVEVKTRTNNSSGFAEEAINRNKIRNIKKAIASYVYLKKLDLDLAQFDVIVINIDKLKKIAKIKHYLKIF
jgi:putative endonuclease